MDIIVCKDKKGKFTNHR